MNRAKLLNATLAGSVAGVLAVMATASIQACRPITWPDVQRVVDVACIVEHATLHDNEMAQVCKVTEDLLPLMRSIAGEHLAGLARAGATQCYGGRDGGRR